MLKVTPGGTYELEVQISARRTRSGNTDRAASGIKAGVVFSKKPHKPKPPSWYLIAGLLDSDSTTSSNSAEGAAPSLKNVFYSDLMRGKVAGSRGELLALKQANISPSSSAGAYTTVSVRFEVPVQEIVEGNSNKYLSVVLSCDAVLGLDVAVKVPVLVQA